MRRNIKWARPSRPSWDQVSATPSRVATRPWNSSGCSRDRPLLVGGCEDVVYGTVLPKETPRADTDSTRTHSSYVSVHAPPPKRRSRQPTNRRPSGSHDSVTWSCWSLRLTESSFTSMRDDQCRPPSVV